MAWIESHTELLTHPKILELRELMGWDLDTALGKLHRFWWWCLLYAEDGELRKHNDARLGGAVGLNGTEATRFVKAMVTVGLLDRQPCFRIHDWWDRVGYYLMAKYKKSPHKWEAVREKYGGGNSYQPPAVPVTGTEYQPNQPNQPKDINTDAAQRRRVFMQHLTHKLQKQGKGHVVAAVKKTYGIVVAWLAKNPQDQEALSAEIDQLPGGMTLAWYTQAVQGLISRRQGEWQKQQERLGGQSRLLAAIEAKTG